MSTIHRRDEGRVFPPGQITGSGEIGPEWHSSPDSDSIDYDRLSANLSQAMARADLTVSIPLCGTSLSCTAISKLQAELDALKSVFTRAGDSHAGDRPK